MPTSIIDNIVAMWNSPPSQRSRQFVMNRNISASHVWEMVRQEHSTEEIRSTLVSAVRGVADVEWNDGVASPRQMFEAVCALSLMRGVPELSPDLEVTKELVRKMNCVGWCLMLQPLVSRQFDHVELYDTLRTGVRDSSLPSVKGLCLEGLHIYTGVIYRAADDGRLKSSVEALEREVLGLRKTSDKLLLDATIHARRYLWAVRRRRSDWPRLPASEFVACGGESLGAGLPLVVERKSHAERSIEVSKLELRERCLSVDYECLDPWLLPEDCPSVIESAVLESTLHSIKTDYSRADEVVYVHTVENKMIARRPAPRPASQ